MNAVVAESVVSLPDFLGRSDVGTQFHANEYERASDVKMQERERVADFLLGHFTEINWVYLLSLPGRHWLFEQIMLKRHSRMQCVGLERSATTFAGSLQSMPGASVSLAVKSKPVGERAYDYARTPAHPKHPRCTAQSHRMLHVSSDAYIAMLSGEVAASGKQRHKFVNKFGERNAVWLDFTSGFCRAVDETIAGLDAAMNPRHRTFPVAITLMYGRDIVGKEIGRINHIHRLNPNFEPVDYWTYSGLNGCPMITVCGRLHTRTGAAA